MLLDIEDIKTLYVIVDKANLSKIYSDSIGDFYMYSKKPPISKTSETKKVLKIDAHRLRIEGYERYISQQVEKVGIINKYHYSGPPLPLDFIYF